MDNSGSHTAVVPEVGMTFTSKDDAYNMYNSYARSIGFSIRIRKSTTRLRTDSTLYQKHIVCSNKEYEAHIRHMRLQRQMLLRGHVAILVFSSV